jgi:hypothetical protein
MNIRNQRKATLASDVFTVPIWELAGTGCVSGADI